MGLFGKRLLDLTAAVMVLAGLSPLLLLIGVLVRLTSPGPVLYRQTRVGRQGRLFSILKFRTMVDGADRQGGQVHHDDPRITRPGRFLRRFSLDELPQFWNILTGDMSLVGPRPAPPSVAARLTGVQSQRLRMRPGLTGWAQIHGRNSLSWSERADLDVWYVTHWTLWLDLRILVRTVLVVFGGRGLYGKDGWNRGYM